MAQLISNRSSTSGLKIFLALFLLWIIFGAFLIYQFDRDEIFKWVNVNHNNFLDAFFYFFTYVGTAIVIIPVLLFLYFFRYKSRYFLLFVILCQVPSLLINQAMKFFFKAKRPAAYFEGQEWWHKVDGLELHHHNAFPSGHTAGAFAFFCVLSMLLSYRNRWWAIVFFILALLAGYSRIYLSQHFFADVYFGSMEGIIVCLLGWVIAKPILERKVPYMLG